MFGCVYLFLYLFSVPFGLYPGVELQGYRIILCLHLGELPNSSPWQLHHFTFPRKPWGFQFLHTLTLLVVFLFFIRCEGLSHCDFDVCKYPWWLVGLSVSSCADWQCVFWETSILKLSVVCCILKFPYTFWTLDTYQIYSLQIPPPLHPVVAFPLSIVFFDAQKFKVHIKPNLLFQNFVSYASGVVSKSPSLNPSQETSVFP